MRLSALEPWIIAAAFAVAAGLCAHVAVLSGYIATLMRLYGLSRVQPHAAFWRQQQRWREQRRLYLALAASCASEALAFALVALGWG